jgi:AcrR family transcriptional regulator
MTTPSPPRTSRGERTTASRRPPRGRAEPIAPRRSRRETQAENDARLLAAGRTVFLQRGFHGASLDLVSREAGLTKGAVYARFEGKADLFLALLARHVEERLEEMRRAARGASAPADAARRIARQWMKRSAAQEDWALLLVEFRVHAARDAALLARYRDVHAVLSRGVATLLRDFYAARDLEPPLQVESMARLALAVGNGLALERWAERAGDHAALAERVLVALAEGRLGEEER